MFIDKESNPNIEITNNLEVSLQSAYNNLIDFSQTDNFLSQVTPIFGENITANTFQEVIEKWESDDLDEMLGIQFVSSLDEMLGIQFVSSQAMEGANGAFSAETSTIYLSSEYFSQDFSNPDILTGATEIILEEVGHFIDTKINPDGDTPGDEGEIFAATILEFPLTDKDKQLINLEEDSGFVSIDGKQIAIEKNSNTNKIADKLWDSGKSSRNWSRAKKSWIRS